MENLKEKEIEYKCEWCGKIFASLTNLKVHKETAKYCIKKRILIIPDTNQESVIDKISFGCQYCNKQFTRKSYLDKHQEQCVINHTVLFKELFGNITEELEYVIVAKNNDIDCLENKIEELECMVVAKNDDIEELECVVVAKNIDIDRLEDEIERLHNKIKTQKNKRKKEKIRKNKIIEEYKLKSANSDGKIEILKELPAQQIKNSTNTTINNNSINQKLSLLPIDEIQVLDEKFIRANLDKYTFDLFLQGEDGIVAFIKSLIQIKRKDGKVERNLICTDASRGKFYRLAYSNLLQNDKSLKEWITDGKAKSIELVLDIIFPIFRQNLIDYNNATPARTIIDIKNTKNFEENFKEHFKDSSSLNYLKSVTMLSVLLSGVNPDVIIKRAELLNNIINKIKDITLL